MNPLIFNQYFKCTETEMQILKGFWGIYIYFYKASRFNTEYLL